MAIKRNVSRDFWLLKRNSQTNSKTEPRRNLKCLTLCEESDQHVALQSKSSLFRLYWHYWIKTEGDEEFRSHLTLATFHFNTLTSMAYMYGFTSVARLSNRKWDVPRRICLHETDYEVKLLSACVPAPPDYGFACPLQTAWDQFLARHGLVNDTQAYLSHIQRKNSLSWARINENEWRHFQKARPGMDEVERMENEVNQKTVLRRQGLISFFQFW